MKALPDILQRILAVKHEEVKALRARYSAVELSARALAAPPPRDFTGALRQKLKAGYPAIIAEIKRASPSKGIICQDFSPRNIAIDYAAHGAACLSVLTDRDFFKGGPEYLVEARNAVSLPVLRKDFIVDSAQIYEARAMGADAILLIAAALPLETLLDFEAIASTLNMATLVEVHDHEELDSALHLNTPLIGINNRDLRSFDVDLATTFSLLPKLTGERILITESGILTRDDVKAMQDKNVRAFLVGEAFMREPSPGLALKSLFGTLPPSPSR